MKTVQTHICDIFRHKTSQCVNLLLIKRIRFITVSTLVAYLSEADYAVMTDGKSKIIIGVTFSIT